MSDIRCSKPCQSSKDFQVEHSFLMADVFLVVTSCILVEGFADSLKDSGAFTFTSLTVKVKAPLSFELTQRHCVPSENTWVRSNFAVKTSDHKLFLAQNYYYYYYYHHHHHHHHHHHLIARSFFLVLLCWTNSDPHSAFKFQTAILPILCDVPITAVGCSENTECFPSFSLNILSLFQWPQLMSVSCSTFVLSLYITSYTLLSFLLSFA